MKEEKEDQEKLLCPKAGTATSFPGVLTKFPTILNVVLWMKKEACAYSIIKAIANDGIKAQQCFVLFPKSQLSSD